MTTKNNHNLREVCINVILKRIKDAKIRRGPAVATFIAFLLSASVAINSANSNTGIGNLSEFEVGKVAEHDVEATKPVSYIDEDATNRLIEEQKRLVPAVFLYVSEKNLEAEQHYDRFVSLCYNFFEKAEKVEKNTTEEETGSEDFRELIYSEFPNVFPIETLDTLSQNPEWRQILSDAKKILIHFMEEGIFSLPGNELIRYNPITVEVVRHSGTRTSREQVSLDRIVTLATLRDRMNTYLDPTASAALKSIGYDLLKHFFLENLFFSKTDTEERIQEASARVKPAFIHIEQGQRIIKKGFIVKEEDMVSLNALSSALSENDVRGIVGQIFLLLMLYVLFIFIGYVKIIGRNLSDGEIYLLTALTSLYIIGAALAKTLPFNNDFFPISLLLPTALAIMLPSILIGSYLAFAWAFVLPLASFLTGSFDLPAYIIALVSGIVGSCTLHNAERRMDLVKAGIFIAAANCIAVIAVMLIQHSPAKDYPMLLFWAAFNGMASGMLVLGILPLLESGLNAATTFRLIELSDLNAPAIRRLFTIAPGTYSHSFMVAQLAEAACQEIGANSLLARVGAYYHDIGKMEQPEYFVENQSGHNKHDEIPPRLSATILRSHVKLGIEKGRNMKLPKQVIDIIAEHHGNSVIQFFYHKALEQEKEVSIEDFSYPGNPPRSRESAVVMLADTAEAAVRTLEKKTAIKIEEFIQTLINSKLEHGLLAESELTFRDLETIKKAFVRVLASYYHSRIEYPKETKEKKEDTGVVAAEHT
ncbi:MAG: HDIG domain-containing protein [Treponema sp.]|jgi:putative nucleotidyltransferase with HDIG domain|nr:HDIG domain-containing protein [Treponema sp.]